ncbi:MAG: class I SAM-dependent methyltransferase [Pseudomonadota bacterium]
MLIGLKNYIKFGLPARVNMLRNRSVKYQQWAQRSEQSNEELRKYLGGTNLAKEQTVQWLMAEKLVQEPFSLLDVGCGPGVMRAVLNRHPLLGRNVIYTGIDQSEAAFKFASEEFAGKGTFKIVDIQHDPLPQGPFDVVTINAVVEHISGYEAIIDKCLALKPKIFILTTFAVTHRLAKSRLRWNPGAVCFMNTYPFSAVFNHIRNQVAGPIFVANFGPGTHKPADYWFPYRGGTLFYCRMQADDLMMTVDPENPPTLNR